MTTATTRAVIRAKEIAKNKRDFKLCLNQFVCPKCSGDLDHKIDWSPPFVDVYVCTSKSCGFKYEEI